MREFPAVSIRLVVCATETPNRKVGVLIDLAREARYPHSDRQRQRYIRPSRLHSAK